MDLIEKMAQEALEVTNLLVGCCEPSLAVTVENNFRKSLLLASASYFESEVVSIIQKYTEARTIGSKLQAFVTKKGLSRQYHTLFNWDGNNANSFVGLFGEEFSNLFKELVRQSPELDSSVRSFLEVGRERNRLVHQNFGSFALEKTAEEIRELHLNAKGFIRSFERALFDGDE
jgi:hypothetical protein